MYARRKGVRAFIPAPSTFPGDKAGARLLSVESAITLITIIITILMGLLILL